MSKTDVPLLDLVIVSPDATILSAKVTKIIVPGIMQELAILPHHTPLYSELVKGVVRVHTPDSKIKEIDIDSGIIRVRRNKVSIILGFDQDIEKRAEK